MCYASGYQVVISQGVIKKSACLDNYLDKNCFGACICKLLWGLLKKIHTIAAAESMGTSVGTPLLISRFCARRE